MKNLKVFEENLKKKVGVIVLSLALGTSAAVMTGCSKDNGEESASNEIVYTVEKTDELEAYEKDTRILVYPLSQNVKIKNNDVAEYDRYIDLSVLSDEDLEKINIVQPGRDFQDNYLVDYVYTVRDGGYTNNIFPKEPMKSTLREDIDYATYTRATFNGAEMTLPNPYKWAEKIFGHGSNEEKTDEAITIEELYGVNGNHYLYYDYMVSAKQKIDAPFITDQDYIKKYGFAESIKEGDYIHYQGIYLAKDGKLELLANKQTGMGSDSDNVKETIKGNFDELMKPISSLENAEGSQTFENSYSFDRFVFGYTNEKVRKITNE